MATKLDYYAILQVHPGAEREVIDAAYRKLAAKYHPDVSQVSNAAERMKHLNIAYEVLSDPARRAKYDASRGMAHLPSTPPHAPGVDVALDSSAHHDDNEIFFPGQTITTHCCASCRLRPQ